MEGSGASRHVRAARCKQGRSKHFAKGERFIFGDGLILYPYCGTVPP